MNTCVCGFTGFLNMTFNILGTTILNIQWKEPLWDVRGITRFVEVNCTDGSQYISELHNISNFGVSLKGTNWNVPVNCCHIVLTTEGNGPKKCDENKEHMNQLQYIPQFRWMVRGKLVNVDN